MNLYTSSSSSKAAAASKISGASAGNKETGAIQNNSTARAIVIVTAETLWTANGKEAVSTSVCRAQTMESVWERDSLEVMSTESLG